MESKQQKFSVWYFVAAVVGLILIQSVLFAPHPENLSYSELKTLVKAGKVSNVVLGKQTITGTLTPSMTPTCRPRRPSPARRWSSRSTRRRRGAGEARISR